MKTEESIVINRPVEDVWKFMTDWSNYLKFGPDLLELNQISSGPLGIGTTLKMSSKSTGETVLRIVEYEPNRKFTWEYSSGRFKGAIFTRSMETIDGKTRLTDTLNAKLSGIYRLLGSFVASRVRKSFTEQLGSVKRLLESEARD